jgi:cob(I)alamin adenosyltransferase
VQPATFIYCYPPGLLTEKEMKNLPSENAAKKSSKKGLVMVITGNGKGKTTSAFGQALRAIGQGLRVCMIQFMKGRVYGEVIAARKYLPELTFYQFGLDSFVMRDNPASVDIELAEEGFAKAKEVIQSGDYDMVILDEINVVADFCLVPEEDLIELIKNKPAELDLILTGRYASQRIQDLADMVSEVREIKHHYNAGIKDRAGIEY